MATLTSANSALTLQIAGLYPVPQSIQGYATDDGFAIDDVTPVEVMMGIDGRLSGGFTPYPTKLHINLQADSPSNDIFDNWLAAQVAAKETYIANAALSIPGLGGKYIFTRGFLTGGAPVSSGKKIMQSRKFEITFESCSKAPF